MRKGFMTSAVILGVIGAIITITIGYMVVNSVVVSTTAYRQTYYVINETNTSAITTGTSYDLATSGGCIFLLDNSTTFIVRNTTHTWTTANYTALNNGTVAFGVVDDDQMDSARFSYNYGATPPTMCTANTNAQTTTWNAFLLLAVAIIVMASVFILSYFGYGKR